MTAVTYWTNKYNSIVQYLSPSILYIVIVKSTFFDIYFQIIFPEESFTEIQWLSLELRWIDVCG